MLRYCRPRGLRPESMPEFTTVAVVSSGNTLDWLELVMLAIPAKMPAPNAPPQSRDQATAHAGLARANARCSGDAKLGLVRRLFGKKRYRSLFNG
jgi:hypothetical protein